MAGACHIVNGSLRPCSAQQLSVTPAALPKSIRLPSSVNCFVERRAKRKTACCNRRQHISAAISAVAATEERTQQCVTASALSQLSMHRSRSDEYATHAGSKKPLCLKSGSLAWLSWDRYLNGLLSSSNQRNTVTAKASVTAELCLECCREGLRHSRVQQII